MGSATGVPIIRFAGSLDLWSTFVTVTVTAAAITQSLPSITISSIPSGVALSRAVIVVKFRALSEHLNVDSSLLNNQTIQVEKAVGGSWITGMNLLNGQLICLANSREFGDALIGDTDIKAQVPDNGATLDMQWVNSRVAAGSELHLEDLQVGLRIWFSAP